MANLDGESVTQSIAALDIDALTYDNIIAVSALRNWYDSLDEAEQANVTNYADLEALEAKVDEDIANLTTHMSEAATALAEVDGRLDALEAFEETHASIEVSDIEGLFA